MYEKNFDYRMGSYLKMSIKRIKNLEKFQTEINYLVYAIELQILEKHHPRYSKSLQKLSITQHPGPIHIKYNK